MSIQNLLLSYLAISSHHSEGTLTEKILVATTRRTNPLMRDRKVCAQRTSCSPPSNERSVAQHVDAARPVLLHVEVVPVAIQTLDQPTLVHIADYAALAPALTGRGVASPKIYPNFAASLSASKCVYRLSEMTGLWRMLSGRVRTYPSFAAAPKYPPWCRSA
jgi:hypothetical protein